MLDMAGNQWTKQASTKLIQVHSLYNTKFNLSFFVNCLSYVLEVIILKKTTVLTLLIKVL